MSKLRADANYPDREDVLRIAMQEAYAAHASLGDVLGMCRDGKASMARRRAMVRIMVETECSASGLAAVWGCDKNVVMRLREVIEAAPKRPHAPNLPTYDADTLMRLRACHGHERAARIAGGQDPATNADIAAWRALGEPKGGAAA